MLWTDITTIKDDFFNFIQEADKLNSKRVFLFYTFLFILVSK